MSACYYDRAQAEFVVARSLTLAITGTGRDEDGTYWVVDDLREFEIEYQQWAGDKQEWWLEELTSVLMAGEDILQGSTNQEGT